MRTRLPAFQRRDGIVSAAAPWVTPAKPAKREKAALARAMRAHGIESVIRACRLESATEAQRAEDESQHWRQSRAIQSQPGNQSELRQVQFASFNRRARRKAAR